MDMWLNDDFWSPQTLNVELQLHFLMTRFLIALHVPIEQNITKAHECKQKNYLGFVSNIVDSRF